MDEIGAESIRSIPMDLLRLLKVFLDRLKFLLQVLDLGMVVIENLRVRNRQCICRPARET